VTAGIMVLVITYVASQYTAAIELTASGRGGLIDHRMEQRLEQFNLAWFLRSSVFSRPGGMAVASLLVLRVSPAAGRSDDEPSPWGNPHDLPVAWPSPPSSPWRHPRRRCVAAVASPRTGQPAGSTPVADPAGAFGGDVRPACRRHDACYDTPGANRAGCDARFLADMLDSCADPRRPVLCRMTARAVHRATTKRGEEAFQSAQAITFKKLGGR